jgi:hypothetical protein
MVRRKTLILRLLGIISWMVALAMLLTVMLRFKRSESHHKR